MQGRGKLIVLAVIIAVAAVAAYYVFRPAPQAPAPSVALESLIKERQDLMSALGESSKTLAAAAKGAPLDAAVVKAAEDIAAGMKKTPSLFPAGTGSDKLKNRAKPEIWADFAKFEAYANDGAAAYATLAAAAKGGDTAAYQSAFTKAAATCAACHKDYRGPAVR